MSVALTLIFPKGALVRATARFSDPDDETTPVDPDTVTCRIKTPAGVESAHVYGVDGAVVRDGAGAYHFDVDAGAVGTWSYRWEGTGAGQAAAEASFKVSSSAFT